MVDRREIAKAFDVSSIGDIYQGDVEMTDLKSDLGTKGHVLVVRGDLAYSDRVDPKLANPKFWLYEGLINSPRVQKQLKENPSHKLFDGVGYSALEAIGHHAQRLGREAVVVMAREMLPDDEVFDRYNIEVIHGDGPMEEGYVDKLAEVLEDRKNLIPLHQALYGAQALAPVGNKVAKRLEEIGIRPSETFWCLGSGAGMYGVGGRIRRSLGSRIVCVEPLENLTISEDLDISDKRQVREFAKEELRDYSVDWDGVYSGILPLHVKHANRYLLINWALTGNTGIDGISRVPTSEVIKTQEILSDLNPEYNWTKTTALALVPAIKSAEQGNNVLVMAYGKNRKNRLREIVVPFKGSSDIPWLFRWKTPLQKIAASVALAGYLAASSYLAYDMAVNDTPHFNGFAVVGKDGKTWVSGLSEQEE
jgi:hypothetical protein